MKDLIFEVDDYSHESYMKKHQVDMGNLKDRIKIIRTKVWGPWKDLTTDALDFYLRMIPDLMIKRHNAIHKITDERIHL
jgi:hypothetical protein